MRNLLVAAGLCLGFASFANATPAIVSGCKLKATVGGFDGAFIIGITAMEGKGTVTCHDPVTGRTNKSNVAILLGGFGTGPQIAIPTFEQAKLRIYAVNAGITSPKAMFGEYHLGQNLKLRVLCEQVSVGRGVSFSVHGGLGASVNLNVRLLSGASCGFGAELGYSVMTVIPQEAYRQAKRKSSQEFEQWKRDWMEGRLNGG